MELYQASEVVAFAWEVHLKMHVRVYCIFPNSGTENRSETLQQIIGVFGAQIDRI